MSNSKLGGGGGIYLQPSPEQVRKPLMEPEPTDFSNVDSNGNGDSGSRSASVLAAALHDRTRSRTPSPKLGGKGGKGGSSCSVVVEMRQLNGVSPPPITPPPPPPALSVPSAAVS